MQTVEFGNIYIQHICSRKSNIFIQSVVPMQSQRSDNLISLTMALPRSFLSFFFSFCLFSVFSFRLRPNHLNLLVPLERDLFLVLQLGLAVKIMRMLYHGEMVRGINYCKRLALSILIDLTRNVNVKKEECQCKENRYQPV